MRNSRLKCLGVATSMMAVLGVTPAVAQQETAASYPSRPVHIVVPFSPGSSTSVVARQVAHKIGESLKQQVLVDNKPGASGSIGLNFVAKAPADGYTLGLLIVGHLTLDNAPYDVLKDFAPISQLSSNTYALAVSSKLPVKTISDLIALAKAKPDAIRYGSSGTGGVIHLASAWFASQANVKMTHVPYKGNADAMKDVVGGHLDMLIGGYPTVAPFVKSGQARILGITSAKRLPALPDLPTIQEGGVSGYEVEGWYGLVGPAGTAAPIVDKLSREVARALASPDTQKIFINNAIDAVSSTPAEFGRYIRSENDKWRKVVQAAGLNIK